MDKAAPEHSLLRLLQNVRDQRGHDEEEERCGEHHAHSEGDVLDPLAEEGELLLLQRGRGGIRVEGPEGFQGGEDGHGRRQCRG